MKTAIVTASGSGIGKAIAEKLSESGYNLVLMSTSENAINVAKELGGVGIQGSVTSTDDLQKLVNLALEKFGSIDAVVNNTGHAPGSSDDNGNRFSNDDGHLLDITDEQWMESFEIYYMNVVRMARIVTPIMQKQKSGSIVNISAFAAKEATFAFPTSTNMRMALGGFTKLYSDRYARENIRMNDVLPGYMNNWEWPEKLIEKIPAKRAGDLKELSSAVAFLLSEDAGYITGQRLLVDGGFVRSV